MAAPSWKDIDDKFCVCSICLDQLKELKLMPCLHRYCKDCLGSVIQGCNNVFKCPECSEEIHIPTNGVDGFKTDFYSKSLVEYVQIQQSLKSDEIRECYGCSKLLRVAAYCFKCNDFLCTDCHNFHMTNKTLKDHIKHTLSIRDIEAKNITTEKLAFMRDAPRCHNHPEQMSQLFCETCDNLTVCMACMLGEHKGHDLHEVKALAKLKRKELAQQIETLKKMEKEDEPNEARKVKEKLTLNVNIAKEKLISKCDEKAQKIMKKVDEIERRRERVKQEKQNKEMQIFDDLQKKMENEIQRIKNKYDDLFKLKKIDISNDFQAQESFLESEFDRLKRKRGHFDRDKKELLDSIEKQQEENTKIIETISEHFDNIRKRFETLQVLASGILASENDWSAVQCIPDMCTAAANIMEDLKKESPELSTLTNVKVNYKQSFLGIPSFSKMSEKVERTTISHNVCCYFHGITSSSDGNIVISGTASDWKTTFIIVIDVKGKVLKEKIINQAGNFARYCDFLSQHKVATVCAPNEIGVYDVRDGSYMKKNIIDVISSWPKNRYVTCVATNPVNNHILVGGYNTRNVYVFDDQLKFLHILTLPDMNKWPCDITVSDGHLLVFDHEGKRSYVTTMEGSEGKVVSEFMKPNIEGNNFVPCSVCTDKEGFVYVLCKKYSPYQCYLVQYIKDGSHILSTRKLDSNAHIVTTVETSLGEKLVVATHSTQTLYMYDIIKEG